MHVSLARAAVRPIGALLFTLGLGCSSAQPAGGAALGAGAGGAGDESGRAGAEPSLEENGGEREPACASKTKDAALPEGPKSARGLGTITARVPGTQQVVGGVRLVSHEVRVVVRDGFARTEVEEEVLNETPRVLEGRFVFPVPPGASVSRLALWVGKDLVEGEVVARDRAAHIFRGIVDDTVRPRDPALLEWVAGAELSLKIVPIPARGSRRVVFAYDEALPSVGGRVRYVYPLSLGEGRETSVDRFAITVTVLDRGTLTDVQTPCHGAAITTGEGTITARFEADRFVPRDDFALEYRREGVSGAELSTWSAEGKPPARSAPGRAAARAKSAVGAGEEAPEAAYAALRVRVDAPEGEAAPARERHDRVIVLDASYSQSRETFRGSAAVAARILRGMRPDEAAFSPPGAARASSA